MYPKIANGMALTALAVVEGSAFWLFHSQAVSHLSPLGVDTLSTSVLLLLGIATYLLSLLVILLMKNHKIKSQLNQYRQACYEYNPNHDKDEEFGRHYDEFASKTDSDSRT